MRWRPRLSVAGPLCVVALANIGPLLLLLRISLLDDYPAAPGRSPQLSGAAFSAVAHGPGVLAALWHSVALAGSATAACLFLAFPLAYHVARHVPPGRRGRRLLLLMAPFWAGEVVRMFALATLLSGRGAVNAGLRWVGLAAVPLLYNPGATLLGTVFTVLPTTLLPLFAALERLPTDLHVAAADLGAGPWQRLRWVTLPLAAPGIVAGCALTFLASLGVLSAPALLGGSGAPVFAATLADSFGGSAGRWPESAALGLVLLGTGLIGAALIAVPLLGRRVRAARSSAGRSRRC